MTLAYTPSDRAADKIIETDAITARLIWTLQPFVGQPLKPEITGPDAAGGFQVAVMTRNRAILISRAGRIEIASGTMPPFLPGFWARWRIENLLKRHFPQLSKANGGPL